MKRTIICLATALLLSGCGEDSVKQAIEANGFTSVQTSPDIAWWGCDKNDMVWYNTKFKAIAVNGKHVEGVACGGWLKGWTVRIEKVL